jgi:hypothetical protein
MHRPQQLLTYASVRAIVGTGPHRRVRILAAHDPLRNIPRGSFTLGDFSYERADLCQNEFGNCQLRNLGARA